MEKLELYTDGACSSNPGPGGWAFIILNKQPPHIIQYGSFKLTTNNRCEIYAVIKGLQTIKNPSNIIIYTDSQHLINCVNKGWIYRWQKANWYRNGTERVKNIDLWKQLLEELNRHQKVEFQWIKGHAENPINNECDRLARVAIKEENFRIDVGYEALL